MLLLQSCSWWLVRLRPGTVSTTLHPPALFVQAEKPFTPCQEIIHFWMTMVPLILTITWSSRCWKSQGGKRGEKLKRVQNHCLILRHIVALCKGKITFHDCNAAESKQNGLAATRDVFQDCIPFLLFLPATAPPRPRVIQRSSYHASQISSYKFLLFPLCTHYTFLHVLAAATACSLGRPYVSS